MKKPYRSMSLIELDSLIREQGLKRPPSLGGIRAVAQPTQQDVQARREMIDSLEEYDRLNPSLVNKYWKPATTILGLLLATVGIILTVVFAE